MYDKVQSEVLNTARFDENSDLSMTYLGRTDMTRASKIKSEEKFSTSEQGYMVGKLLDGTECQILLDTGASKSLMSKSHYLRCKSLHSLPKFASKTQRIQVGNGQYISVLFIHHINRGQVRCRSSSLCHSYLCCRSCNKYPLLYYT